MSIYTLIVIIGTLMIIGGISLAATPLMTFVTAGYFIIILFFVAGIIGIIRAVHEKRYDRSFIFSILSIVLGMAGLVTPGAAAMNNFTLLYMAATWLFVHGVMTIISSAGKKDKGDTFLKIIGVILGVLEICLCVYSVAHPVVLAINIGILIGLYYIEQGVNTIILGSALSIGRNNVTLIFTVIGVLTIIGGFSMIATPLRTFVSIGYCIILLFFMNGVLGIVHAISQKCYDRKFAFAILSLILGIIGFTVPGIATINNFTILYIVAAWLLIHGILTIIAAVDSKDKGAGKIQVIFGVVIGVLELIMCILSVIYPMMLAFNLGILVGFYFFESGANMIFVGSNISKAAAIARVANEAESSINK